MSHQGTYYTSGAAMTWDEIALALGYPNDRKQGTKAVFMLYRSGMRKLRSRPETMQRLHQLAQTVAQQRDARARTIGRTELRRAR